jgi:hypothetical protein
MGILLNNKQNQDEERFFGIDINSIGKTSLIFIGIGLFLLGVFFIGGSYSVVKGIKASRSSVESSKKAQADQCVLKLKGLGLPVIKNGDFIEVKQANLDDIMIRLGEVSLGAIMCPGWKLTGFCAGEGCAEQPRGLWLKLQPL